MQSRSIVLRQLAQRLQHVEAEPGSEARGEPEQRAGLLGEASTRRPTTWRTPSGMPSSLMLISVDHRPSPVQHFAFFHQVAEDLARVEGVAAGLFLDQL